MADIPNLNTIRSGRGGLRGRGFRRGGRAIPENDDTIKLPLESEAQTRDRIIQQTDNDATSSRLSAIELGYLKDRYTKELGPHGKSVARRYPIINRGTYVRSQAIDTLIVKFLNNSKAGDSNIISLGAGSDSRYWRLTEDTDFLAYHELDFEANVAPKQAAIDRALADQGSELARWKFEVGDDTCSHHLHAIDLRELAGADPPELLEVDWTLPTLILTSAVIEYFTSRLQSAVGLVLYEPIRPNDAFGKTMVTNLGSRGIHMQTLKRHHSLETQRQRLKLAGLDEGRGARDVNQIWDSEAWIPKAERERVEGLEWLDEVEEWKLLASHYCVAWGWRGKEFSRAWGGLEGGATEEEHREEVG